MAFVPLPSVQRESSLCVPSTRSRLLARYRYAGLRKKGGHRLSPCTNIEHIPTVSKHCPTNSVSPRHTADAPYTALPPVLPRTVPYLLNYASVPRNGQATACFCANRKTLCHECAVNSFPDDVFPAHLPLVANSSAWRRSSHRVGTLKVPGNVPLENKRTPAVERRCIAVAVTYQPVKVCLFKPTRATP